MNFPACDGTVLKRGEAQCVFTQESVNRLGDRQQNATVTRCIRHGNPICDVIVASSLEAARKIAARRAEEE